MTTLPPRFFLFVDPNRRCFQPCTLEEISASLCPRCRRSVLCFRCSVSTTTIPQVRAMTSTPPSMLTPNGSSIPRYPQHECESLARLSILEHSESGFAGRLLGNTTVYVRMLLRLLAIRAEEQEAKRRRLPRGARGRGGAGKIIHWLPSSGHTFAILLIE